jgi:hypothetical protein
MLRFCRMATRQPASQKPVDDHDMQDVGYLRARAHHLRAAAASSRDPEIARALREVAGDFDSEAQREEALHADGHPDEGRR